MRRIQNKMAAYISSSSTPKINWAAQDMSLEYLNFEDMCEMMFYGPLAEHRDNDKAKFSYMSLWGGPKALELFHNSALCNQKTSNNLLLVLKDYCNDNELYNELSCNKGTFDDEIDYYLGKADQDNESHKVCNKDLIAKSYFDDLRANNSLDIDNINNSSSSTTSSNDNIDNLCDDDSDKDYYSDNLLISEEHGTDRGNLLVSGDNDNDHYSHNNLIINSDTTDDHNQSNEDEPLLDNSDMDFLGKSGSAKENIQFPPDLFNGVRHLQCECERNLLSSDDDEHILFRNDNDFLGSGDHTYSNDAINIVTIKDDSLRKCENLGSGERIQIDNLKTVNDDKSVTSISNYDNPHEGNLNFLGSGDSTLVQAIVPMKGLDVCLMEEDNLASFVDEQLWNLRDFIVNDWPNSKTDIPVSKLCHWFLQDELGYYSGVLMKGS